jgi:hypothetical protein
LLVQLEIGRKLISYKMFELLTWSRVLESAGGGDLALPKTRIQILEKFTSFFTDHQTHNTSEITDLNKIAREFYSHGNRNVERGG